MAIIYKVTNTINRKCYVGYTERSLRARRLEHEKLSKKNPKQPFVKALSSVGLDNFVWEILYESADEDHTLNVMEEHFIRQEKSHVSEWGYNATYGGERNTRGTVTVLNEDGTTRVISNNDPEWLAGNLRTPATGTMVWRKGDVYVKRVECPGEGWVKEGNLKGKTLWIKDEVVIWSEECPGEGWETKASHNKGKNPWTKGDQIIWSEDCPGEGWTIKSSHNKGKKPWTLNGQVKYAYECPGEGWVPAGPGNKGMKKWEHGNEVKWAHDCPGEGWTPKKPPNHGKVKWNNGEVEKFATECPGEDWTRGKLKNRMDKE